MSQDLPRDMVRVNIFTFPISIGSYVKFISQIFYLSEHKPSSYVCFANVHMTIEAYDHHDFNTVLNSADLVAPDGQPISLFLRVLKRINQERVCGLDVFPHLLREAESRGKSIYLYGTTDQVLHKISEKARREFPGLNICGFYSPPFRTLSKAEDSEIVNQINNARPDLIFVALGCPKQEIWMAQHKGKIHGCMVGLGHAFQVYAGTAKRCPVWMRTYSLEWVYRLCSEPRRLWKRYLYTNTYFLILTLKYLIQMQLETFSPRIANKYH
jgi:N-acetylglucosaminyldiphosphoundecaprenol N-acetyl-beta-D-mannosaminyltransferase